MLGPPAPRGVTWGWGGSQAPKAWGVGEVELRGSGTHTASNNLWERMSGGYSPVGHLWDDVMPILVI